MGRFDALTTLDSEPVKPAAPKEKPASQNTSTLSPLPEKHETDKPASRQTGKQVNLQTGKQVFIEKYSSYLTHEYKRELKRIAFESDRNAYEVLLEAVEHYLARQKHPK